tara:strand:- start:21415 stop:22035 length:621 start_codon:yes stop_codon:yes gene_type:complete
MNNYFANQPIHWNQFSSRDIYFKSNAITKKLLPEDNILSWKTKESRHNEVASKTGATAQTSRGWNGQVHTYYSRDSYKGVFVQLTNVKKEYVTANLDFINYKPKKDSQGNHLAGLDALVYIGSFHDRHEWVKDSSGNYSMQKTNKVSLNDYEGYRIAYGGQGDSNYLTHRELIEIADISESVKKFLIDMVLPLKRGILNKDLALVA